MDYTTFLAQKAQDTTFSGFDPIWEPSYLFDFQRSCGDWNIRKGKSATFLDW